jgi:hypothetical protein
MRDANIHREAFRDDGPDYPVQQGLTFPAIVLVVCLVVCVMGFGIGYMVWGR